MVYDIFPFNNELDLLEIRLNTLKDLVDVFILTESIYTFSGDKKPLYFNENRDKFRSNEYKILNIVIDENMPIKLHTFEKKKRKLNEFVQRNSFITQFKFKADDILLIGDIDEIPHPGISKIIRDGFDTPIRLNQKFYYYYMNCRCKTDWVTGTVLLKSRDLTTFSQVRESYIPHLATPGGWHFSYLNDIKEKIGNLVEVEFDLDKFKKDEWILYCMENQIDIFGRNIDWYIDELDVPNYVLKNMDKFGKYIYKGESR